LRTVRLWRSILGQSVLEGVSYGVNCYRCLRRAGVFRFLGNKVMLVDMKRASVWLRRLGAASALTLFLGLVPTGRAVAGPPAFPPEPSSGSIGLQGEISTAPPTRGATITTPSNGATFTTIPITVAGLCPTGLLVKIFANNVFVGSTVCQNGSYSVQV